MESTIETLISVLGPADENEYDGNQWKLRDGLMIHSYGYVVYIAFRDSLGTWSNASTRIYEFERMYPAFHPTKVEWHGEDGLEFWLATVLYKYPKFVKDST